MSGLELIAVWSAGVLIITGILYLYDHINDQGKINERYHIIYCCNNDWVLDHWFDHVDPHRAGRIMEIYNLIPIISVPVVLIICLVLAVMNGNK